MTLEDQIRAFVAWMRDHGHDGQLSCGMLMSPGCSADYGCCSKTFDLGELAEGLTEFIGIQEPQNAKEPT